MSEDGDLVLLDYDERARERKEAGRIVKVGECNVGVWISMGGLNWGGDGQPAEPGVKLRWTS